MRFALKAGLALRDGRRLLEVTRILNDEEVQIEDALTRRPRVISKSELLKRVFRRQYEVVAGDAELPRQEAARRAKDGDGLPLLDLSQLSESAQREIDFKLRYVKTMHAGHISRGQRQRIDSLLSRIKATGKESKVPTATSVMDWMRRYETSGGNALALLPKRMFCPRPRRKADTLESLIADTLRQHYFVRSKPPLRHAHDVLRREVKLRVARGELAADQAQVSLATLYRRVKDVDAYHRIAAREGDCRARMVCRTPIDGASAAYPLQRVEVDHTPLNWVVICDRTGLPLGRPLLTSAIDAFSGYVVGFYLSFYGPGVTSVAGVVKVSIITKDDLTSGIQLEHKWLSHGIADEWQLDNGMEFHSRQFKALCWELGTDMTYCRVRTPWLKPHVERFFGELNWLTLDKGRVRKPLPNEARADPYKEAAITFCDLVKGLTMFVVDVHPFQVNQRKLARPFDLFSEGLERCPPAIYPGDEQSLRLASALCKELRVDQGGVTLLGLPYGGPELLSMRRRHGRNFRAKCKWDPDDMGSIYVQDPVDGKWVMATCTWSDYAQGLSWNQHRVIREFKRRDLREMDSEDTLWRARLRLHDHWQSAVRPRTRESSLLAARFAGLTSSRVLSGDASVPSPRVVAPEQLIPMPVTEEAAIPDFDGFDLEER
jgi:putative transposase